MHNCHGHLHSHLESFILHLIPNWTLKKFSHVENYIWQHNQWWRVPPSKACWIAPFSLVTFHIIRSFTCTDSKLILPFQTDGINNKFTVLVLSDYCIKENYCIRLLYQKTWQLREQFKEMLARLWNFVFWASRSFYGRGEDWWQFVSLCCCLFDHSPCFFNDPI